MKRTTPAPLIGLFLLGAVAAYLLELVVQSRGGFIYVPPISLALTLVVVAVAVVLLAIPIRRKVTGKRTEPVDPFYAARVLALAKASSFAGALQARSAIRPAPPSIAERLPQVLVAPAAAEPATGSEP